MKLRKVDFLLIEKVEIVKNNLKSKHKYANIAQKAIGGLQMSEVREYVNGIDVTEVRRSGDSDFPYCEDISDGKGVWMNFMILPSGKKVYDGDRKLSNYMD